MARKKSIRVLWGLLGLYLLLAGCGPDKVAFDLLEYLNQGLTGIAQLEQKAQQHHTAVTGPNFTSEEALREALKTQVIPLYGRFLDLLHQIQPRTEEVRQLHLKFIRGTETAYRGLKLQLQGLEKKDPALVQEGNTLFLEHQKEGRKWVQELQALAKAHGVGPKAEKKQPAKNP